MNPLLIVLALAAGWHGRSAADAAAKPSLHITLKIVSTSSPRAGVILTTDEEGVPSHYGGTPVVQISSAEADAVLAFLTESNFIATARDRREVGDSPRGLVALQVNHAGVARTGYSGASLKSLGYLERVSDHLSPAAQQEVLSAVDRIKHRHYRKSYGRDMVYHWLSAARKPARAQQPRAADADR